MYVHVWAIHYSSLSIMSAGVNSTQHTKECSHKRFSSAQGLLFLLQIVFFSKQVRMGYRVSTMYYIQRSMEHIWLAIVVGNNYYINIFVITVLRAMDLCDTATCSAVTDLWFVKQNTCCFLKNLGDDFILQRVFSCYMVIVASGNVLGSTQMRKEDAWHALFVKLLLYLKCFLSPMKALI